jgi:hypothetical protein
MLIIQKQQCELCRGTEPLLISGVGSQRIQIRILLRVAKVRKSNLKAHKPNPRYGQSYPTEVYQSVYQCAVCPNLP